MPCMLVCRVFVGGDESPSVQLDRFFQESGVGLEADEYEIPIRMQMLYLGRFEVFYRYAGDVAVALESLDSAVQTHLDLR